MQYNKYSFNEVKNIVKNKGLYLLENKYVNSKTKMLCKDSEGYYGYITLDQLKNKSNYFHRYHPSNNYTIYNINHYAKLNHLNSICISEQYISSKEQLLFKCSCGNTFYTTRENFIHFHKTKCNKCSGYNGGMSYDEIKENLASKGYYLEISREEFNGITKTDLLCCDDEGYKYKVIYDAVMRGHKIEKIHKSNPFAIYNINLYLTKHNVPFDCISNEYVNAKEFLLFKCQRCGEIVKQIWRNINKNDIKNRFHVICPNCDGRIESIHALVLKQMFKYYYPDTVEEDPTYINEKTGKISPTDIVNHRLKIAIEIQSQWHDFDDIKEKDIRKKKFWINKGYAFYDPDIRDYTVLEMCQLFFNIDRLPNFINYNYSNKLNIKQAQELLNNGLSMNNIAKKMNVSVHRLYDAVQSKKISYPTNYIRGDYSPVIQFDMEWNEISRYKSIAEAAKINSIPSGNIASILDNGRYYSSGYYWRRLRDIDICSSSETAG